MDKDFFDPEKKKGIFSEPELDSPENLTELDQVAKSIKMNPGTTPEKIVERIREQDAHDISALQVAESVGMPDTATMKEITDKIHVEAGKDPRKIDQDAEKQRYAA
jgi:hypothetical protein